MIDVSELSVSGLPSPDGSGYPLAAGFAAKDKSVQQDLASKKIINFERRI